MSKLERDRYKSYVGHTFNDSEIWGQYEMLVDFIYDEYPKTKRRFDEVSLPILFVLSHFVELALNENIKFFKNYHESDHLTKFENWTLLLKSHDLEKLSYEFKTGYYKLHKKVNASVEDKQEFIKYYDELQKLISVLNRNTSTFRYTYKLDKNGKNLGRSIPISKTIDFMNLKNLYEKAKILFSSVSDSLQIYTDFIDFKRGNPEYKKGSGYLYCRRLFYTENFLDQVKTNLNEQLTRISDNKWLDSSSGEFFETEVWEKYIYIIAM